MTAGSHLPGGEGPGKGKHVVLISGDEEYRSEEALPQLAKILAKRHGFTCTVLFAIGQDGTIDPGRRDNIPGLEALEQADLMVLFTRFRDLPDDQMKRVVDYVESGRPIIGMRTATHAFDVKEGKTFARYGWKTKEWEGGFGRNVLGETWISHHGSHGKQSTRGVIAEGAEGHPILRGIKDGDIWGPTDVYGVRLPLPGDSKPLVLGQVLEGMKPTDKPVEGKVNDPMMPVAWVKTLHRREGQARARLHDHDGGLAGPGERRHAPAAGQRLLLGRRAGGRDQTRGRRGDRGRVQAPARSASGRSPKGSGPPTSRPMASEDVAAAANVRGITFYL